MPLAAPAEPQVKIEGEEITITIGPREYRVLGLEKSTSAGPDAGQRESVGPERARRVLLSRRHVRHGELPAAGGVHQAGGARTRR